jgi:DNA segregation ATPase FtsK/SpoIIIE, S-DNA-T family
MAEQKQEPIPKDNVLQGGPRRLIRELRRLLSERAQRQETIESDYASRSESTQNEIDQETNRIETEARNTITNAESEYKQRVEKIERDFAANEKAVNDAHEQDREALLEKAEENISTAKKQMEEAIWLSETVYEGGIEQPRERYEQAARDIAHAVEEARAMPTRFDQALKRARITGVVSNDEPDPDANPAPPDPSKIEPRTVFDEAIDGARSALSSVQNDRIIRIFTGIQPIVLLIIGAAIGSGTAAFITQMESPGLILLSAVGGAGAIIVILGLLYLVARLRAKARWRICKSQIALVNALQKPCLLKAEEDRRHQERALQEVRDREINVAKKRYESIHEEIMQRRDSRLAKSDEKYPARLRELKDKRETDRTEAKELRDRVVTEATEKRETALEELRQRTEPILTKLREERDEQWRALQSDWNRDINDLNALREAIAEQDAAYFPDWSDKLWNDWHPPETFPPALRIGRLDIDLNEFLGGVPNDARLPLPLPEQFTLPALLDFPANASLLAQSTGKDGDPERSVAVLQNTMLRLLTALPPGKVRFTIVDPVGLGQNFAGFMHLADFNEELVTSRIWTEQRHIEQRLSDLTEHMEKVIQKYLRNEYETIDEYNRQAGEIAEPYRFLVIADFPSNFSESALRRLNSIVTSGPRCGVFVLMAQDVRQKIGEGLDPDDLLRHTLTLKLTGKKTEWDDEDYRELRLTTDPPPTDAFITRVLNVVGKESIEAGRVEVPFETIAPDNGQLWSLTTNRELRVPLGKCGATKLQYLTLGRGTAQHALIAGKTGSGKSTLLHALVTNVSLWYSPDEVELYLVDFKKGVEFKTYAVHHVPHIRAIAIESDREFGLSVLQRLDEELHRRGELYRRHGVQDLAAFRATAPDQRMPRTLLIIDEFQEFFVEDDRIAQDAAMLLDRLVRQGRAFGIHVLLGSQTLGGAYTLARSTIGQMAVRIALQCSEADSYLILSDDNAAARLLSRPGEAIYNDSNGMIEGNSPFQVVWLPEPTRDRYLKMIEDRTSGNGFARVPAPIVFEGNIPADVRKNEQLATLLSGPDGKTQGFQSLGIGDGTHDAVITWLGEAIAIKDPTAAVFRRHSGHNMLMVGQRDDAALAIQTIGVVSIAAQQPDGKVYLFDGSTAGSDEAAYIAKLTGLIPQIAHIVRPREVADVMAEINAEFERRQNEDDSHAPPVFLMIYALQRFRDLRQEDDFSFSVDDEGKPPKPGKLFSSILRDGPTLGIHTVAWCDTVNNINRTLERSGLREFEMRVLFQMSASDSSMLIDSPNAAKLGFHRGLYHSEEEGREEKFRPYALPDLEWIKQTVTVGG